MEASAARDEVLDRALSISPTQFENLCRILVRNAEPTRELELTPRSGDDGIDVHAVIDRDVFRARLGVQAKRNDEANVVTSGTMRRFKGSLREGGYHVGTFVTTSTFSGPAVASAEQWSVRLLDGPALADLMVESELGVVRDGDGFATDHEFWDLFELAADDRVRSDAVPQADVVDHLNIVLRGIDDGYNVKPQITEVLERATGEPWDPRQADYYPHAAWPLGFVHKDTTVEYEGHERRQWVLSRIGAEYVEYLETGNEAAAEALLEERIREMAIAKPILRTLRQEGRIDHDELQELVMEHTLPPEHEHGLSKSTADRRGNTLGRWLEKLPEVTRHGSSLSRSTYEFR